MGDKSRELRRRQGAIGPGSRAVTEQVRSEVLSSPGGGGTIFVIVREIGTESFTVQRLKYTTPSTPVPGAIESVGETFTAYPVYGMFLDQFVPYRFPEADETIFPLSRVTACRANKVDGAWLIEPVFNADPGTDPIDADDDIAPGSGG